MTSNCGGTNIVASNCIGKKIVASNCGGKAMCTKEFLDSAEMGFL